MDASTLDGGKAVDIFPVKISLRTKEVGTCRSANSLKIDELNLGLLTWLGVTGAMIPPLLNSGLDAASLGYVWSIDADETIPGLRAAVPQYSRIL